MTVEVEARQTVLIYYINYKYLIATWPVLLVERPEVISPGRSFVCTLKAPPAVKPRWAPHIFHLSLRHGKFSSRVKQSHIEEARLKTLSRPL